MSFIISLLSIGPMTHVDFKKWPCRCVEFRGQGPHKCYKQCLNVGMHCLSFKGRFHETTKIIKINHRCIQIDRWVKQTCRHRLMDIGAVLADDQCSYFTFGRQEVFLFKSIVQCSDESNHKIALKFSKT